MKKWLLGSFFTVLLTTFGLIYHLDETNSAMAIVDDYAQYSLTIGEETLIYKNIGRSENEAQNYINVAAETHVATWGGKKIQDNFDGHNTHFIGHNPGVFHILKKVEIGDEILVKDEFQTVEVYQVKQIVIVDDSGHLVDDPSRNIMQEIIGIGTTEQITLQTCLSETTNLVIMAYPFSK
ncbi:sortase domain-containing protein [Lactococcus hodotermopsidis]|nr:sortase [Lactococcus hodotermopsidis]